jgi:hypothetical protein
MTITPTPVHAAQRTLFARLWENESQENETYVLLLPVCPFDSGERSLFVLLYIQQGGKGWKLLSYLENLKKRGDFDFRIAYDSQTRAPTAAKIGRMK